MKRRHRGLVAAALVALLSLAALGTYALVVHYQGRDIRGTSTVEFNPADVPTPRAARSHTTKPASKTASTVVWATYGFDANRVRVASPSSLRPPFRPVWLFHGRELLEFPPAIAYGRLYLPTFDGRFYALDPASGRTIWEYGSGRCAWASPAVADHLVFQTFLGHKRACVVANSTQNNGELVAFDALTGKIRWRTRVGSTESSPLVVGTRVYIGDWNGEIIALNTANGRVLWRYQTDGRIKGSAAYAHGHVYIGSYDGHIYALGATSGRLLWRAAAQPRLGHLGTFYSTPAAAYGRVYIGSTDGKVYSYGATTGALRWSYGTGGYVYSSPAVWHKLVLIGSYDGSFYALDAATGQRRWQFRSNGRISGSATVLNGIVYFSTLAERTYALNATTGRLIWSWPDGKYSPVVADRHRLYLIGYARMWGMVPK